MLQTIETLTKNQQEMSLADKLAQYRRQLMLNGLEKDLSKDQKAGIEILNGLNTFKTETNAYVKKHADFESFRKDPLGRRKHISKEQLEIEIIEKFKTKMVLKQTKENADKMGIDSAQIELNLNVWADLKNKIQEKKKSQIIASKDKVVKKNSPHRRRMTMK